MTTLAEFSSRSSPLVRGGRLETFLACEEEDIGRQLVAWLDLRPGEQLPTWEDIIRAVALDVAAIDSLVAGQVQEILHHPRFQKLESTWRGLQYLVLEREDDVSHVQYRVLNLRWSELARDLETSLEFDQSQLFRWVYEGEFGMAGGEPFGVLLGDYEVRLHPDGRVDPERDPDARVDGLEVLRGASEVAAASFAPFLCGAHPSLLGLDESQGFGQLELPRVLDGLEQSRDHDRWRALRGSEDSRFAGLLVPRVLMRSPWRTDIRRSDGFLFEERIEKRSDLLWGRAIWAFGRVLVNAFRDYGWLGGIRGVQRGLETGGLVTGLTEYVLDWDVQGSCPLPATDVVVTDAREKELADLGFIALCRCVGTPWSAFYTTPSVHFPRGWNSAEAQANENLSYGLQYVFCVSRFAHYLKVLGRDKTGSFSTSAELQSFLQGWLLEHTAQGEDLSDDLRRKYPLREASVRVQEVPSRPGSFRCTFLLQPHFQLDQLTSTIELVTEITNPQRT